jgi:hypothetical protein
MEEHENGIPHRNIQEFPFQLQLETVSKKPCWWVMFNENYSPLEISFMSKYYDDIEGIITASEELPYDNFPTWRYQYNVGAYKERDYELWDEDLQRMQKHTECRLPYNGEVGLIQQAFDAATGQSRRTGEDIVSDHHQTWTMTPPCDLSIDIQGAKCRLLWGLSFYQNQVNLSSYEFDFFMCGREFLVSANFDLQDAFYDLGNGGIEYLQVTLLRGEPFVNPCWGHLVS